MVVCCCCFIYCLGTGSGIILYASPAAFYDGFPSSKTCPTATRPCRCGSLAAANLSAVALARSSRSTGTRWACVRGNFWNGVSCSVVGRGAPVSQVGAHRYFPFAVSGKRVSLVLCLGNSTAVTGRSCLKLPRTWSFCRCAELSTVLSSGYYASPYSRSVFARSCVRSTTVSCSPSSHAVNEAHLDSVSGAARCTDCVKEAHLQCTFRSAKHLFAPRGMCSGTSPRPCINTGR